MPPEAHRADGRSLLLRHRGGDAGAFAELVTDYRVPIYSYLTRCAIPEADRDDLFQTIFIKVHASAGQYQADRPFHPWIFTVVANSVRSYFRKRRVRELVFAEPLETEPVDEAPGGETVLAARQTVAWLNTAIPRLPLPQREVLLLFCVENLPLKQIADALGQPLNTVKTHLRRARLALARGLAQHNAGGVGEVSS